MKLELKNIKHTQWASEETHCYQAALYVDGTPVAFVSNDGRGGSDRDFAHPKFKGDYRETMKAIDNHFASLPRTDPCKWCPNGLAQTLEFWCSDQVNYFLSSRELKRKLKSHVLFNLKDKSGIYQSKARPSRAHASIILNDLPFDEALTLWSASA